MSKRADVRAVVDMIEDGATLVIGGAGASVEPDLLLETLEQRFLETGHPRNLTVIAPMLPGDRPGEGGLNCIAHEGMLARLIGSSFNRSRHPRLLDMIAAGGCEAQVVGMGVLIQLLHAAGSSQPGVFTRAGLGSYLDPRNGGGRLNERTADPIGRIEHLEGQEYIFYPTPRVDWAFIRGTTADVNGYVSMEEEPNTLGMVELALAAHASGGRVVVQVKRIARGQSLDPRLVRLPGPIVDHVVVHPTQRQVSPSMADPLAGWNPFLAGALRAPLDDIAPMPHGAVRLLLRRAALELQANDVVNLGAGIPTHLPRIALEEGALDRVTFTNEHGVFGGLMATAIGGSFVPALNADAIMDSGFQFAFYDGGGLDVTFLGVGEVDQAGDVNVSRFGAEINGSGGFNNIIERTPRIVFCTTFASGGLVTEVQQGRLLIAREGRNPKFVTAVEQRTFNAARALRQGQQVRYVTERAVFDLGPAGLVLSELAPGVELAEVRAALPFELDVSSGLRVMDASIFADVPLNLASHLDVRIEQ
jgi:propionate CoA-transferase